MNGTRVIFIEVPEMGHVWPGGVNVLPERLTGKDPGALNATAQIWDFFNR